MITNCWYVATESDTLVADKPLPLRMLGHDFVLFRDSDGKAHALSDVCIHRGGALGRGKVVKGTVQCPYHGWRFEGDGRCVDIPSLGADAAIPKRARVDSYPVEEQWGWVWVFLGDLPAAERPKLPGSEFFPEYETAFKSDGSGTGPYRITRGRYLFDVNWMRAIDNVLDPAHPFHVHTDFGHLDDQRIKPFKVEDHGDRLETNHTFKSSAKRGVWREGMSDERPDTINRLQFHMTGLVLRNDIRPNAGMHHFVFSAYLPIDENKTMNYWIHVRNFFPEEKYDADTIRRNLTVFEEDAVVLNHVLPGTSPRRTTREFMVEADAFIVAFRAKIRAMEEKGWMVDTRANAAEDDVTRVIPCPARGADPKSWVLDPTLTRKPSTRAAAAE